MAVRTICIPVAEVIDGGTKAEFYAVMREAMKVAVVIANRAMTECVKQDDWSLEKCSKIYTYPKVKDTVAGCSNSISNLTAAVESDYRSDRWFVIRGKKSLRSYRSMSWPVLNNKSKKQLKLEWKGEFMTARIKIMDKWFTVRLAGGSNHRDQVKGLRRALECGSVRDSKTWIDRKGKAILGIVVDVPVEQTKKKQGEARVASTLDSLCTVTFERSHVPFVVFAEDVKEWKEKSRSMNQKWRQARKQGANRRRILAKSQEFAHKMNRRLKSRCHEVSSQIVTRCIRANVAKVVCDFTIKSYCDRFPWYMLRQMIKYKCEMNGIEYVDVTQEVKEPDLSSPHVYFVYDPHSERVKIGKTKGGKGRLTAFHTSNPDWVVLAVDNQPQTKLTQKEKHYHAMFDGCRVVERNKVGNELFVADRVIAWLRSTGWLGNAGNLSQIMQVLAPSQDGSGVRHLKADGERVSQLTMEKCSHKADNKRGYTGSKPTALAVT
jgi:transposase